MPVLIKYFTVTITAPSTLSAPQDGFIDPNPSSFYVVNNGTDLETGWPTSLTTALAKNRANLRWLHVIQLLESTVNPLSVFNITTPGATYDNGPTSITFTVSYDRSDYLSTSDELNTGTTLYGSDAVSRYIARSLIDTIIRNVSVLDPTIVINSGGASTPQVHRGETITEVTAQSMYSTISNAQTTVVASEISLT